MDRPAERILLYDGRDESGVVMVEGLSAAGLTARDFFRRTLRPRLLPGQQADWQRYVPATDEWLTVERVFGGDQPLPPTPETLRFFPMVGREVAG